jgi:hypothetical protein
MCEGARSASFVTVDDDADQEAPQVSSEKCPECGQLDCHWHMPEVDALRKAAAEVEHGDDIDLVGWVEIRGALEENGWEICRLADQPQVSSGGGRSEWDMWLCPDCEAGWVDNGDDQDAAPRNDRGEVEPECGPCGCQMAYAGKVVPKLPATRPQVSSGDGERGERKMLAAYLRSLAQTFGVLTDREIEERKLVLRAAKLLLHRERAGQLPIPGVGGFIAPTRHDDWIGAALGKEQR